MVKATHRQTFIGVWLHDNKLPVDVQTQMILGLNQTFYYYKIFVDGSKFSDYIDENRLVAKIYLIVSVSNKSLFGTVNLALNSPGLFEKVYIFSLTSLHTQICFHTTDLDELFNVILESTNQTVNSASPTNNGQYEASRPITTSDIDKAPASFSVLNSKLGQGTSIQHLTKESFKFISFLLLRDILTRTSYGKGEVEEMCTICRCLHPSELSNVDELENFYDSEQAIQYYTRTWFLFRTINSICATENMQDIYKFRVYISDLHKKLAELDQEQERDLTKSCIEDQRLYRGKSIAGSVLQQLIDNKDGLISINGFLSTTIDYEVALKSAGHLDTKETGMRSTLFLVKIHRKVSQPYAYIRSKSIMPDELEVLFSLGTIWRIVSTKIDKELCTVELTSCEEQDFELAQLLEKYRCEKVTLMTLGDILLEFGDESEAEWCYRKMSEEPSNSDETNGRLYYNIGMMKFKKNRLYEAREYFIKAESYFRQAQSILGDNALTQPIYIHRAKHPFLTIYYNMGLMLENDGKFNEAIEYYRKASNEHGSRSEKAKAHNSLGLTYLHRGKYAEAEKQFQEAIQLIDESHLYWMDYNNNCKCAQENINNIAKIQEKLAKQTKNNLDKSVCDDIVV